MFGPHCLMLTTAPHLHPSLVTRSSRVNLWQRIGVCIILLTVLDACIAGSVSDGSTALTLRGAMFYTDDVALFSSSRRLSLNADPTQPALDNILTGQGSDAVFQPALKIARAFNTYYGDTTVDLLADGYVFLTRTAYSHATLRAGLRQAFTEKTALNLTYYFSPDLYLGENFVRNPSSLVVFRDQGFLVMTAEQVTSNIVSLRLDQELTDHLELRLLGRYGLRDYNPAFSERNLTLWTIGPHLQWQAMDNLKLLVGYHFEQGIAAGRHQPQYADDVSYDNDYVSGEIEYEFGSQDRVNLGFHYERNNWLSEQRRDERNGAWEEIFQGELILFHDFDEQLRLFTSIQYSSRFENILQQPISNTNAGMGLQARF